MSLGLLGGSTKILMAKALSDHLDATAIVNKTETEIMDESLEFRGVLKTIAEMWIRKVAKIITCDEMGLVGVVWTDPGLATTDAKMVKQWRVLVAC